MDGRNCWKTMVPSENCVLIQCWRTNFLNSKTSHLTHAAWNWSQPYLYVVFNANRKLCPKKIADKMVQLQNNTLNRMQRWLTLKSTLPWISIHHHERIVSEKKMADKLVQLQNITRSIIQRCLTLKSTLPLFSIQHHLRIMSKQKRWRTKLFISKTLHLI